MEPIDSERLAALWVSAQPKIAGYIASLIRNFDEAADVLQNVGVVVVRKREEYDPSKPFLNWAIQIARLEVLQHRRKLARDRHCFDETLIDDLTVTYQREADVMEPMREALALCVEQLQGRSKEALVMRHLDGLKPPEIARRLQIAPDAARSLMYRARRALQHCIERRLLRTEATS